jgi:hypothetical protein
MTCGGRLGSQAGRAIDKSLLNLIRCTGGWGIEIHAEACGWLIPASEAIPAPATFRLC